MDTITVALAQITRLVRQEDPLSRGQHFGGRGKRCGPCRIQRNSCSGYPFWIQYSKETAFNSPFHKAFLRRKQAVVIERGDLDGICRLAAEKKIAVYLGIIERPGDRGESVYASLVYISKAGEIGSVHRKLMPTYDERMTWAVGDGNGLRTHRLGEFTVGGELLGELDAARPDGSHWGEDLRRRVAQRQAEHERHNAVHGT